MSDLWLWRGNGKGWRVGLWLCLQYSISYKMISCEVNTVKYHTVLKCGAWAPPRPMTLPCSFSYHFHISELMKRKKPEFPFLGAEWHTDVRNPGRQPVPDTTPLSTQTLGSPASRDWLGQSHLGQPEKSRLRQNKHPSGWNAKWHGDFAWCFPNNRWSESSCVLHQQSFGSGLWRHVCQYALTGRFVSWLV